MDPQRTAYHEAGHAVAAVILNTGLIDVDVRPQLTPGGDMGIGGANMELPTIDELKSPGNIGHYLVTVLAGWHAERMVCSDAQLEDTNEVSDGKIAYRYAIAACCTLDAKGIATKEELDRNRARIERMIQFAHGQAEKFVRKHAVAIANVASALLEHKKLAAAQVRALMNNDHLEI